jgi:elongation factor P hydroxylase
LHARRAFNCLLVEEAQVSNTTCKNQRVFALLNESVFDQLLDVGCVFVRVQIKFWLAFAFAVVAAGELRAQGFLIPETTRRDMVFDFAGHNLYISTSTGLIRTFHLSSRTFGTSYNLGGSLNGIDIARNNSFILAAQNSVGISQGTFQRVNLATGTITNINYPLEFGEGGAWDVAIGSNGLALVTTLFQGSGYTPLRQIDLSTNAMTIRGDAPFPVWAPTQIHRSADGTRLFFMEGNISSGPVFTYSAITNIIGSTFDTNAYLDGASGAVNRNGSLIALRTYGTPASLNTAPNFDFVHSFNGIDSGVAFDAVRDVFYGVNSATDEIIAYSTTTYAESFSLSIGEDVGPGATQFGTGTLVASADGRWIALETDSGIRLFQIPNTMIWYLNNNVFTSSASGPNLPAGWQVVGVADFNHDGHPDYLLYNAATRRTVVWYMNNTIHLASHNGPTLPSGWSVVSVADFNGDGHPDYLLFNPATHETVIWYLVGTTFLAANHGPTLPSGWQVVATSDFNGNGRPDLVLYRPSTQQTAIWYMNNNVHVGSATGPTLPGGWSLVATADFNGDGHPDYLLFKANTRQTVVWYMNNNVHIGGASGPTLRVGWSLAGVADFNGDGHPDYLLFNASL